MIDYDAYYPLEVTVPDWYSEGGHDTTETLYVHKASSIVVQDREVFEDWLKGMLG